MERVIRTFDTVPDITHQSSRGSFNGQLKPMTTRRRLVRGQFVMHEHTYHGDLIRYFPLKIANVNRSDILPFYQSNTGSE